MHLLAQSALVHDLTVHIALAGTGGRETFAKLQGIAQLLYSTAEQVYCPLTCESGSQLWWAHRSLPAPRIVNRNTHKFPGLLP